VDEDEHEVVRALRNVVVSTLARVEVPAALWRKHRVAVVPRSYAATMVQRFEADFYGTSQNAARFVAVAVAAPVLDTAAGLVAVHGLRAYGGVQLATALAAREIDSDCHSFACFDRTLRAAAAAHGFALVPA
jgi:predicted NBD/HSP70 family sugar kinase